MYFQLSENHCQNHLTCNPRGKFSHLSLFYSVRSKGWCSPWWAGTGHLHVWALRRNSLANVFFANLDCTLVSDLWKGLKFGEELSQLSWETGQISFQRKSGVLYLSRFGSREVVGDVTEEGVEVVDPVVEGEEGMKPVKPKLSPATFFLFFFLWFNFMCTSKFLTCGYIFNDLETTFGNQQIVILNTYPHITEGALLFSHSRLLSLQPLLAWNKKLVHIKIKKVIFSHHFHFSFIKILFVLIPDKAMCTEQQLKWTLTLTLTWL